jgi:hypothetical protein
VWLLSDADEPAYEVTAPPTRLASGTLTVHRDGPLTVTPDAHLYVGAGTYTVAGTQLNAGDSVRAREPFDLTGAGELLVIVLARAL